MSFVIVSNSVCQGVGENLVKNYFVWHSYCDEIPQDESLPFLEKMMLIYFPFEY